MKKSLTESVNPNSRDIDLKSIPEILNIINNEDMLVPLAVQKAIPEITLAVEAVVKSLESGGRLIYYGAGTSGRIGVVDAAECAPTYTISQEKVFAVIAGGYGAMVKAHETAEDEFDTGIQSIIENNVTELDTIIGLSASGNTPFVTGALQEAKKRGASTVGIISNAEGTVLDNADVKITLLTGPEVITGSTRMKAATAQKLTVNMISTTSMIKLGRVTGNFMTAMRPSNDKLRKRARFIVSSICDITEDAAGMLLEEHNYNIRESVNTCREQAEKAQQ